MMNLHEMVSVARGEGTVDTLFTNARIINVFSGEIKKGSIAVANGYIVGIGDYEASQTIDLGGRFVAPGFIDSHVHIESSMACVAEFAKTVVSRGTTAVIADPHEIANVSGVKGIEYMIAEADGVPCDIYFSFPSCVPATHMETSGAILSAEDVAAFMGNDKIVALAEMMNFPGVIYGEPDVLKKIEATAPFGKPVDGHAPGLSGKALNAYVATGISSDHECTTPREAIEKLAAGMHIMVREGTCARNLEALFPLINDSTSRRMMWCTDDRHPHDLIDEGHIDSIVKRAIDKGLDPITAICMATINPAEYFGLNTHGAIAPGRKANFTVFSDLADLRVEQVFHMGKMVAENGVAVDGLPGPKKTDAPNVMNVDPGRLDFSIKAEGQKINVIEVIPDQVVTRALIETAVIENGCAVADASRDLLKIAVIDRYSGNCSMGKGFVRGIGLKKGAIASSVAHDSHNIIVVGVNDMDMAAAVKAVVKMGGGFCAVSNASVVSTLPLPIAGLMSFEPVETLKRSLDEMISAAKNLGSRLSDPFMTLGFIALPVIPELKITDKGLVDVNQFKLVPLFVDSNG